MFDANARLTDNPDKLLLQILLSAERIEKFARDRVPVECIHRDIASFRVHFPGSEHDGFGMPAVRCLVIFAKRRDLEHMSPERDAYAAEQCRTRIRLRKVFCNVLRLRIGSDIDVLRNFSEEHVTDSPADPPCVVSRIGELLDDVIRLRPMGRLKSPVDDLFR